MHGKVIAGQEGIGLLFVGLSRSSAPRAAPVAKAARARTRRGCKTRRCGGGRQGAAAMAMIIVGDNNTG